MFNNHPFVNTLIKTTVINTAGAFGAMLGMAGAVVVVGAYVDHKNKKTTPSE